MSSTDDAPEQACPSCGHLLATAGLEPFSKVECPGCGAQVRVERTFENYKVVEPLGAGGMGSVFKAHDTNLHRFVALKLLRREFAGDQSFTENLQKEARITGSIKHPHVVEVFSVGEDHGQFYVVMELVDRGSLDDRIEDQKHLSEMRTLEVGLQVAKGLQAALKAGLIHRDIKPGNILFSDAETAKIVDFGLALFAEQKAEAEGEIWGTPYYIAPERLTGQPEDFRSDLYSLGATLFHAIAGRPTFSVETQSAAELKELKDNPPKLKEVVPDVSDQTAAVIDKMLQSNPADRHSSYKELIRDLQAARAAMIARDEELRARWSLPVQLLALSGMLLALAGLGYGIYVGLHHLPDWRSHFLLPGDKRTKTVAVADGEATPVVDVAAQIPPARREFQAGHYGAAEALFREIAVSAPEVQPMVDLCAGLQLWESGEFAQAAEAFRKFRDFKPATKFSWMNQSKPLAQERLADFERYEHWQKTRDAAKDPEALLRELHQIQGNLKTQGALSFQLADEETKLTAQIAQLAAQHAEEDKAREAVETPKWKAALTAAQHDNAAYQFENAVAPLDKVELQSTVLRAARANELQRQRWLAAWKAKLIGDINGTGFGGAVTDIHGVRYDGPIHRATAEKFELKTRYGSVMTDWRNLSPQVLLSMSTAFIRAAASNVPERQWLCAIFAQQTGQAEAARDLAQKAAAAKSEFRDLLARYFPDAKK
ncbi:MAG: protein kinase [Chthoniobacterales bacterium]|nr:protein kinase [Chthoniobacterales bacterium]